MVIILFSIYCSNVIIYWGMALNAPYKAALSMLLATVLYNLFENNLDLLVGVSWKCVSI